MGDRELLERLEAVERRLAGMRRSVMVAWTVTGIVVILASGNFVTITAQPAKKAQPVEAAKKLVLDELEVRRILVRDPDAPITDRIELVNRSGDSLISLSKRTGSTDRCAEKINFPIGRIGA